MRQLVAFLSIVWVSVTVVACGGSVAPPLGQAADSGAGADTGTTPDAGPGNDATLPPPGDANILPSEDAPTPTVDAGACAPPSDPTKGALCITISPEAIAFTSDPNFDGKGPLVAQVFGTNLPDLPDGGSVVALATGTTTQVDLSQPVPVIRFDNLAPGTVYPRAVFADPVMPTSNLAAGFWLGGYDLSGGIKDQTPVLPTTVSAGSGTAITMNLMAVRGLTIGMTLGTTPAGNGEGPAVFIVTPAQAPGAGAALFGLGKSPCARVDGNATAQVSGFVIGKGPYYVAAVLDDFGLGDGGISLPPGSLASLTLTSQGGAEIPVADALMYAANAYTITSTVSLSLLVSGDAGTDTVTCP
jgi:hypothetical protein